MWDFNPAEPQFCMLRCSPCVQPLLVFWLFAELNSVHSGSRFITSHAITGTDAFFETAVIRSLPSAELFCD